MALASPERLEYRLAGVEACSPCARSPRRRDSAMHSMSISLASAPTEHLSMTATIRLYRSIPVSSLQARSTIESAQRCTVLAAPCWLPGASRCSWLQGTRPAGRRARPSNAARFVSRGATARAQPQLGRSSAAAPGNWVSGFTAKSPHGDRARPVQRIDGNHAIDRTTQMQIYLK